MLSVFSHQADDQAQEVPMREFSIGMPVVVPALAQSRPMKCVTRSLVVVAGAALVMLHAAPLPAEASPIFFASVSQSIGSSAAPCSFSGGGTSAAPIEASMACGPGGGTIAADALAVAGFVGGDARAVGPATQIAEVPAYR